MAKRQRSSEVGKLIAMVLTVGLFACSPEVVQDPPTESPSPTATAPSPEPTTSPTPEPSPDPEETAELSVYWLASGEEKLELAPTKIKPKQATDSPAEQLKLALERLLQGPANADVASGIPEGTKLNTLAVKNDGIHVDLSKEFTGGGGSAAMQGRLGQLIYTASSLNPKESVWISVDGEPLTVLGGEGLEVSQPMTRQEFQAEFSL